MRRAAVRRSPRLQGRWQIPARKPRGLEQMTSHNRSPRGSPMLRPCQRQAGSGPDMKRNAVGTRLGGAVRHRPDRPHGVERPSEASPTVEQRRILCGHQPAKVRRGGTGSGADGAIPAAIAGRKRDTPRSVSRAGVAPVRGRHYASEASGDRGRLKGVKKTARLWGVPRSEAKRFAVALVRAAGGSGESNWL
jgi:hypothetical protein